MISRNFSIYFSWHCRCRATTVCHFLIELQQMALSVYKFVVKLIVLNQPMKKSESRKKNTNHSLLSFPAASRLLF